MTRKEIKDEIYVYKVSMGSPRATTKEKEAMTKIYNKWLDDIKSKIQGR